jgi:hypothetical protein
VSRTLKDMTCGVREVRQRLVLDRQRAREVAHVMRMPMTVKCARSTRRVREESRSTGTNEKEVHR